MGERRGLLLGLGIIAGLVIWSMLESAPTFDEDISILGGVSELRTDLPRINGEHPPLAKMWLALPARLLGAVDAEDADWRRPGDWQAEHRLALRFLYDWNREDAGLLVFLCRMQNLLLGLALALLAWVWARRHGGPRAGWLALGLVGCSPGLLAHMGLATLDLPLALGVALTLFLAEAQLERPRAWGRACLTGLALGATLLVKAPACLLCPLLLLLAVGGPRRELLRRLAGVALSGAVALLVVAALYGFDGVGSPSEVPGDGLAAALRGLSWILPRGYVDSLRWQLGHAGEGHFLAFLHGERAPWFASWFPQAFLLKATVPELCALAAALWLGLRKRLKGAAGRACLRLALAAVAWFVAVSVLQKIQIGVRYLLPLQALWMVLAAVLIARLAGRFGPRLTAWLLLAQLATALLAAPHQLAYLNPAGGGIAGGHLHLSDSNVDWGQDLPGLAAWWRDAGEPPLYLSYFGTADPAHWGLRARLLRSPPFQPWYSLRGGSARTGPEGIPAGSVVAISVTNLHGLYLADPDSFAWLRRRRPSGKIGGSILLYRIE